MKSKTVFVCKQCGNETPRWQGQCPACGAWNSIVEFEDKKAPAAKAAGRAGIARAVPKKLKEVTGEQEIRFSTGMQELDRVLGGGGVRGSLILVGGAPGIGKSTLLLQASEHLARGGARVLYISGEESVRQIKMRARRLGVTSDNLLILSENAMDAAERRWEEIVPDYMIIDSIQTMYLPEIASAPGSVSQVRECASLLMRLAKNSGCSVFLVGHVTKEGSIAGPRILEHMVDAVLYFEGDRQQEYRLLRAVKNRFGSVNELGVFQMTEEGMQVVENPSEQLLSHRAKGASGSVVFCGMEGSRPLLVDVQALASPTYFGTPRRTVEGADTGRVALLLAVCVTLLTGTWAQARSALLASRLVRLHVIAVSEDDTEQAVKLQVRDAVLAYLEPQLADVTDMDTARLRIADDLDGIARAAQAAAGERPVRVSLGPEHYPTRDYGTFALPAGVYTSLRVTLGAGAGHNWWCVIFPPLCAQAAGLSERAVQALSDDDVRLVTESDGGYVVRFRLLELWDALVQRLS